MTEKRSTLGLAFGTGIRATHLKSGEAYGAISPAKIAQMARDPQSVPKSGGAWFLPSNYLAHDARQHDAQRSRGEFHMLVLDIDQGDLPLVTVRGLLQKSIGSVAYLIYATKSASQDNRKWRVLVPVASPIKGQVYEQVASAFMDRLEEESEGRLISDRAAARPGQVFFLPNRGEFYEFDVSAGERLYEPPSPRVLQEIAPRAPASVVPEEIKPQKSTPHTGPSPIQHFNETHDLVDLLVRYGYVRNGQSDHFRSPLQTTESYATRVYPDTKRWVSMSGSDAKAGLGRPSHGCVSGDAFDLYVFYEHGGDFAQAVATWARRACITGEDEPQPPTPAAVVLPAPANLEGSGLDYLQQVLDEHRGEAAEVFAVALRLSLRVPHEWSPEDVRNLISGYAETPIITAIMYVVDQLVDKRKTEALRPSRVGIARAFTRVNGQAAEHQCEQVDRLAQLPDRLLDEGGVFAIRAPMGSGKTQHIGRPLSDWARKNGYSFIAIAHRVSLVAEMARRLGLSDYRDHPNIDPRRLAICLPSILKEYAQTKPQVVFLDEIVQALHFLVSEKYCSTNEGGPEVVFKALCNLIKDAHVVVVADANLNDFCIEFLSFCRPGESFKIIEMLPTPTGKVADIYCGSSQKVSGAVGGLVLKELQAGGKVWLAVERPKLAKTLQQYFSSYGYRVLCVHSDVKGQKEVAALLADADFNSRKYDIVIASPVISSGVSIEHRDGAHFSLGAYIGGGWVTTPADAMQQMGRVRYLRRFIVGIEKNNVASSGQVWTGEIKGRVGAANLEQSSASLGPFDGLIAHLKAAHENGRSDFGAGLYWHLETSGWEVNRKEIVVVDEAVSQIAKLLKEEHECALTAVGHVDDATADLLRRMPETEETAIRLEAYAIQQAFAVDAVTEDELLLWANGQFARQIERFEDALGIAGVDLEQAGQIVHRSMHGAKRLAYEKLLSGVAIRSPDWGTPEVLEVIVDRLMLEPDLYVTLGVLPRKYASRRQRRDGSYKPPQRPKNVGIVAEGILTRLGLKATKTRTRIDGHQVRVVGTDMEHFARILEIAERRSARNAAGTFHWGEDDDLNL